ncbi:MAG: hypothetical protein VKO21_12490 [Candidatus Sericytochromatia bacterium]|nr:hypothetical protein [Candidatus Sericytochromatia bacterium]
MTSPPSDGRRRIVWQDAGAPPAPGDDGPGLARPVSFVPAATTAFDPLDGTPLVPGGRIVLCTHCHTGYHPSSWTFLQTHNSGACVNCRQSSGMSWQVLGQEGQSALRSGDAQGEQVLALADLEGCVNTVVVFEGRVLGHQVSRASGTHFIKFHASRNPFDGFKLVVFSSDVARWEASGHLFEDWVGRWIRVRGLLRDHPAYGLEILPKTPEQISLLAGGGA